MGRSRWTRSQRLAAVSTIGILDRLGADDRRELSRTARTRRFAKSETIFHEGDPGDTLHVVSKGHVAVRITTPLGDVATVAVLGPGEHFGELSLLGPSPRSASVVALDAVETISISAVQVRELRARFPAVEELLVYALAETVRRLSSHLAEALFVPADKRVLRRIIELQRVFGRDDEPAIRLPVKQEVLAELAGTTRPTANRALRAAEEAGAMAIGRGWIEVLDSDWLHRHSR